MSKEIGLHFGALSKPIADQLAEQGFKTQANFQTPSDYITKLFVMGYLTESETKKARQRTTYERFSRVN